MKTPFSITPLLVLSLLAVVGAVNLDTVSKTSALPLLSLSTSTVSVPGALITEAPDFLEGDGDVEGVSRKERWHVTTYTTCVTLGSYVDCGVHEPVLPGGDEVSGAGRVGGSGCGSVRLGWVGVVAGVVGWFVW